MTLQKKRNKSQRRGDDCVMDPVEVYCRIRGDIVDDPDNCVHPVDEKAIRLIPPSFKNGMLKEMQYSFRHVFGKKTSQMDLFREVGFPLVHDLLIGKNGLLFTYGITSSGKTFTMRGSREAPGIVPMSIDMIFNSLGDHSAGHRSLLTRKRYQIVPDMKNGFKVQSDVDVLQDESKDLYKRSKRLKDAELSNRPRIHDSIFDELDPDCHYAVFVSYFQIHNSKILDLLPSETGDTTKKLEIWTNPITKKPYVAGACEYEVRDADEALQQYYRGEKERKNAATNLNQDSSRSHSVFCIRIVQCPTDETGDELIRSSDMLRVSQLYLVDLAGSERTKRTRNEGALLKEAGNINNSLMVLRQCFDALRYNQKLDAKDKAVKSESVPYRRSQLTHVFKTYFEGDGKVRMVVCLNPRAEEYDETVQVLQFAESAQEVQVQRSERVRFDQVGLMAGRRALAEENKKRKVAEEEFEEKMISRRKLSAFLRDMGNTMPFPFFKLTDPSDSLTLPALAQFLDDRIRRHKAMYASLKDQELAFGERLRILLINHNELRSENRRLQSYLEHRNNTILALEQRLEEQTNITTNLMREFNLTEQEKVDLLNKIGNKSYEAVSQQKQLHDYRNRMKMKAKENSTRQQQEMSRQLEATTNAYSQRFQQQETKMKRVRDILNGDDVETTVVPAERTRSRTRAPSPINEERERPAPFVNARYNMASSTNRMTSKVVEHVSKSRTPVGTVLQPGYKKRKSVTKLDLDATKSAKHYLLEHQSADGAGNVETRLFKGDVIPTSGGGRAVIFKDVEVLKQVDPASVVDGKTWSGENGHAVSREVVMERCSSGVMHSSPKKHLQHTHVSAPSQ